MALLMSPEGDLRFVEQAIVAAVRNIRDLAGNKIMLPTIESRTLRQAAKLAVAIASGENVWDGGEQLDIPEPERPRGIVNLQGR